MVCASLGGASYLFCKPDFDFFAEDLSSRNADIIGLRLYRRGAGGIAVAPPGVAQVYGFPAMPHEDFDAL